VGFGKQEKDHQVETSKSPNPQLDFSAQAPIQGSRGEMSPTHAVSTNDAPGSLGPDFPASIFLSLLVLGVGVVRTPSTHKQLFLRYQEGLRGWWKGIGGAG
jgi:hypothetical protein